MYAYTGTATNVPAYHLGRIAGLSGAAACYQLIQDLFISQSDCTDLQAQIGTDSQEYDIIKDDLH